MRIPARVPLAFALLVLLAGSVQAQTATLPYDHIHLRVPDQAAGVAWYEKHFGGTRTPERTERLLFGSTRLIFQLGATSTPSEGSSIDHIGFSVADVDAKAREVEADGGKVLTPARDAAGLFRLAFVQDPWGTKIELVQDAELLGLHHIHLRTPDTAAMFTWLTDVLGGERTRLKGRLDAVRYRAPGFSDVWVLVQQGESTPSQGHAIDHIGWRVTDADAKLAEFQAKGVKITAQKATLTLDDRSVIYFFYIEGPSGTRIELVQR